MANTSPLFSHNQTKESCAAYESIRDGTNDRCRLVREHCEDLWQDYQGFEDKHFLQEFSLHFHSRWFEMYLTVALLRAGISVECPKPGPDILATFDERRVWIEAVCAGPGQPGKPDSVPGDEEGVARPVPIQQYVMRIRSSLMEKAKEYATYAEAGIVASEDSTVVALNVGGIVGLGQKMDECLMRSVYGIGNLIANLDIISRKIVGYSREAMSSVPKASGAGVGVQCFTDGSMAHISALLASGTNAFNCSGLLGQDFILYPNLTAANPWLAGLIPLGREWKFVESDTDWSGTLK